MKSERYKIISIAYRINILLDLIEMTFDTTSFKTYFSPSCV